MFVRHFSVWCISDEKLSNIIAILINNKKIRFKNNVNKVINRIIDTGHELRSRTRCVLRPIKEALTIQSSQDFEFTVLFGSRSFK